MKRIIIISLVSIFIFSNLFVSAQKGPGHSQERWEKYRAEKVRYMTDNLELTPEEAQKFWPVYNQMEKEKMKSQQLRRETERKVQEAKNLSDKEIIELTREFAGSMQKEGALTVKYNEELLKVLSPEKVLKLYKTENEFRIYMIKTYRDRGKHNEQKK